MKKLLLGYLLAGIFGFLSLQACRCFAADESGCFTCHRYPGLVRLEKDKLKALHIDEKAFLNSPHGKLTCKQCHVDIVKVPHTGQKAVRCITSECHADEKSRAVVTQYPLHMVHKKEQFLIVQLQDNSSCRTCHPLYPHRKNNMVRALVNMHTGFMTCEVCHLKRDVLDHVTYAWKKHEQVEFIGKVYGLLYTDEKGLTRTTGNRISRLAVFKAEKGKDAALEHSQDADEARLFLLEERMLNQSDKEDRLKYFHRNVSRKEISVACKECHSPKGILDFRKIGFDEKTSKYLVNLDLPGLVAKYEVFFFPDLFGH